LTSVDNKPLFEKRGIKYPHKEYAKEPVFEDRPNFATRKSSLDKMKED
jgi:hypothetical protein